MRIRVGAIAAAVVAQQQSSTSAGRAERRRSLVRIVRQLLSLLAKSL